MKYWVEHRYSALLATKIINRMTKVMEMKANEAYGPVSSSQPSPPLASEGAYDL